MNMHIYFLYFITYSFFWWVIETIYCSILEKRLVPRGFLNGPITPIYGFGSMLLLFVFKDFDLVFVLFFGGMLVTSILEYITSYLIEVIFDMHLWDYSSSKYNLNGRVKLRHSILFGIGSILLIKMIHPQVSRYILKLNYNTIKFVSTSLFIIFIIDNTVTVFGLLDIKAKALKLEALIQESREVIKIRSGAVQRRLLNTFPKLVLRKDPSLISKLRARILKNKEKQ